MTAIGADPAELDRPPDLGWIATDRGTCLLEHRSELGDLVGISAGDVPDVRVASDETQSRGARGSDPDRPVILRVAAPGGARGSFGGAPTRRIVSLSPPPPTPSPSTTTRPPPTLCASPG